MPSEIHVGKCQTCTSFVWKHPQIEFGAPIAMDNGFRYLLTFKCGSCKAVIGQSYLNETASK